MSINANDFGVPQDRKRVIIVGCANHLDKTFQAPEKITPKLVLKDVISNLPSSKPALDKNMTNGDDNLAISNHEYMTGGFSGIYMSRNRVRSWDEPSFFYNTSWWATRAHSSASSKNGIRRTRQTYFCTGARKFVSAFNCARMR
jgi:DNA (cytosine-5)-methyltransferase 1